MAENKEHEPRLRNATNYGIKGMWSSLELVARVMAKVGCIDDRRSWPLKLVARGGHYEN